MRRLIGLVAILILPAVLHAGVIKWEGKPISVSISTERLTRIEFPENLRSVSLGRADISIEKEDRSLYIRAPAPEVKDTLFVIGESGTAYEINLSTSNNPDQTVVISYLPKSLQVQAEQARQVPDRCWIGRATLDPLIVRWIDREGMKRESAEEKSRRAKEIATRLARAYPEIRVPLHHRNNYELLVATILSAQCTDEMVNKVTPELFRRYPTPETLARAPVREIEKLIRRLGLFHTKARSLKQCSKQLAERYAGEVPATMEELTHLAGVGRKTANVILGHAFGIPGIIVDTHCKRLSRRLGLTRQDDPDKIEKDLMELLAPEEWTGFSHRLILHGRRVCYARNPNCKDCFLNDLCPSANL